MAVVLVAPSGTVTDAGTSATALLVESDTTLPPAGAGAVSTIVAFEEVPPTTVVGDRLILAPPPHR